MLTAGGLTMLGGWFLVRHEWPRYKSPPLGMEPGILDGPMGPDIFGPTARVYYAPIEDEV